MPVRDLAAVLEELTARPAMTPTTRVIAVDGPSGSGKTVLAGRCAALTGAPVVHLDDLYPGWDGLAEAPGIVTAGILEPLAHNRSAAYRRYDWETGTWAESHPVPAVPVLFLEGVGSGAAACAPYLSALIWIEAPSGVRLERGIERDGETYRPHWERWARQEASMFASDRVRDRADVIIDGDPHEPHDPATQVVTVPAGLDSPAGTPG